MHFQTKPIKIIAKKNDTNKKQSHKKDQKDDQYIMLKKFLWRQRTKPRTPTTKNGKFVITFNVLGTPVKHPDNKTTQISQKTKQLHL